MDYVSCSGCRYKEDFSLEGCLKCVTCEWGIGVSMNHTNFSPLVEDDTEEEK